LNFLNNDNSKKQISELINNLPKNTNVFNIYQILQKIKEKEIDIDKINPYELYKTDFRLFL
jgi:hypothetical protein